MTQLDPNDLAAEILAGDIESQPPEAQRLIRYVWARVALDWGILLLIGEDHVGGFDRLVCTLQEDGSCYILERPSGWSLAEEAEYVARVKAILGGTQL